MICKNCNAFIEDDSVFCPSCGQRAEAEPAVSAAPASPTAFHHAGSLDGGSGIGAPVVEKKPAAPQEDSQLRFSSSFKRKSEAPAAHKSDIPHAELPGSMYGNYNPHYAASGNRDAQSLPISAPSYPASAVAKELHTSQETPGIRIPSTSMPDQVAPEKNFSTEPAYPGTQAKGRPAARRKISPAPKKRSVWKYVCAGIFALVVILVSAFFITKAQHPWFEINSAGKLSFDDDVWEFYYFYNAKLDTVEIPKEYDGAIKEISADDDLQYFNLQYEGSFEEFLEEHSWAIQMMVDHGLGSVKCRDYTFSYNKNGNGAVYIEDDSSLHIATGNYSLSNRRGKEILFESWGQMLRWLNTGIYEYSWEDFYGNTYYDELEITLD